MLKATLYHNPRCSKSRGALELLEDRGVELEVIEYLDVSLTRDAIVGFIDCSDSAPVDFVRTGDEAFKASGVELSDDPTAEEVAEALVRCPAAMQRPILVVGDRSIIARPSERVLELL